MNSTVNDNHKAIQIGYIQRLYWHRIHISQLADLPNSVFNGSHGHKGHCYAKHIISSLTTGKM